MECLGEESRISGWVYRGEGKDRDRGVEPGFGGIQTLLPAGTLEGDAGMKSYQDRDEAASTDPVACRAQSPVWLVYDIL